MSLIGDFSEVELQEIAASKSDNAVDIFIYDTSKDSDGGAWRKRTQHTSWYNETLNTSIRGSRREFPSVAVIVSENRRVKIYDGDDLDLPLWMQFSGGTANILGGGYDFAVSAKNGVLCVGNSSTLGLQVVNFVADTTFRYRGSGIYAGQYTLPISGRNTTGSSGNWSGENIALASNSINDVAMTVLPTAPVDPATGIERVTVACATDGGVSVIKDDGTVVDITTNVGSPYLITPTVFFDGNDILFNMDRNATPRTSYRIPIPSVDRTVIANSSNPEDKDFGRRETGLPVPLGMGGSVGPVRGPNNTFFSNLSEIVGLTLTAPNENSRSDAMVAYLTSTYNTGWQNGDIKLTALSDTDDTDLVGSGELVTNGTFDTDLTGWDVDKNVVGNTANSVSGQAELDSTSGGQGSLLYQQVTGLDDSDTYVLSFDVVDASNLNIFIQHVGQTSYGPGQYAFTFTGITGIVIDFKAQGSNTTATIDNVSVRRADNDRSVNNNGLIINGTVQRDRVAPGADLVAYSGFSETDYLEMPYNPDLDFGTGDYCVMGWVSADSWAKRMFFNMFNATNTGVIISGYAGSLSAYIYNGFSNRKIGSVGGLPTGKPIFTVVNRTNATSYKIFVNGELMATYSTTRYGDLSGPLSVFIGRSNPNGPLTNYTGSASEMALWRISGTAPTDEQIRRIYEDEKVLFQENAKCTLYGDSDGVTALAYDDAKERLHVGTSAGRSVFEGLRRVDNTTTGVTTAISAANGLIAEQ